jgi:hypothetical protein
MACLMFKSLDYMCRPHDQLHESKAEKRTNGDYYSRMNIKLTTIVAARRLFRIQPDIRFLALSLNSRV